MEGFGGDLGSEDDRAFENWGAACKQDEEANQEEEDNRGGNPGEQAQDDAEDYSANVGSVGGFGNL